MQLDETAGQLGGEAVAVFAQRDGRAGHAEGARDAVAQPREQAGNERPLVRAGTGGGGGRGYSRGSAAAGAMVCRDRAITRARSASSRRSDASHASERCGP